MFHADQWGTLWCGISTRQQHLTPPVVDVYPLVSILYPNYSTFFYCSLFIPKRHTDNTDMAPHSPLPHTSGESRAPLFPQAVRMSFFLTPPSPEIIELDLEGQPLEQKFQPTLSQKHNRRKFLHRLAIIHKRLIVSICLLLALFFFTGMFTLTTAGHRNALVSQHGSFKSIGFARDGDYHYERTAFIPVYSRDENGDDEDSADPPPTPTSSAPLQPSSSGTLSNSSSGPSSSSNSSQGTFHDSDDDEPTTECPKHDNCTESNAGSEPASRRALTETVTIAARDTGTFNHKTDERRSRLSPKPKKTNVKQARWDRLSRQVEEVNKTFRKASESGSSNL
jgi:hypothetical protein